MESISLLKRSQTRAGGTYAPSLERPRTNPGSGPDRHHPISLTRSALWALVKHFWIKEAWTEFHVWESIYMETLALPVVALQLPAWRSMEHWVQRHFLSDSNKRYIGICMTFRRSFHFPLFFYSLTHGRSLWRAVSSLTCGLGLRVMQCGEPHDFQLLF